MAIIGRTLNTLSLMNPQNIKKTVGANVLKLGIEGLISFDRDDVTLALLGGLANYQCSVDHYMRHP